MQGRGAGLIWIAILATVVTVTAVYNPDKERCTALLVGPKASADGSAMTTHNNDCTDCDWRLVRVPARDWPEGSLRAIYPARFSYPRWIGNDRGDAFVSSRVDRTVYDWSDTKPIGFIPQVRHTFSYLDGSYAVINEKQVAIGESTCDAKLVARPIHDGGQALFDVSELSRIALERASTAREAIQIMGDLAVEYGYYGSEWEGPGATDEAGEALTITDPKEAWHFHILPDDTGKSAVWAAARIPDDHVSHCVNYFVIRQLDLDKPDWFLASPNVADVAKRAGFWDGSKPFDFTLAYSNPTPAAQLHFAHRGWRVWHMWNPNISLSADVSHFEHPFSVKPAKPVTLADMWRIVRDHFEGTPYDLSVGLAAGPWSNPNRYDGSQQFMTWERLTSGHFERGISLHRTSYSYVTQSRVWLPDTIGGRVWFGNHAPHGTAFVPFWTAGETAEPFQAGHLYKLSRDSAWWAFAAVANYAEKMYMWMMQDVWDEAKRIETNSIEGAVLAEEEALQMWQQGQGNEGSGAVAAGKHLTEFSRSNALKTVQSWWNLFDNLIAKYHDGLQMEDAHSETYRSKPLFYPEWWLKAVGYFGSKDACKMPKGSEEDSEASSSSTPSTPPSNDDNDKNNNKQDQEKNKPRQHKHHKGDEDVKQPHIPRMPHIPHVPHIPGFPDIPGITSKDKDKKDQKDKDQEPGPNRPTGWTPEEIKRILEHHPKPAGSPQQHHDPAHIHSPGQMPDTTHPESPRPYRAGANPAQHRHNPTRNDVQHQQRPTQPDSQNSDVDANDVIRRMLEDKQEKQREKQAGEEKQRQKHLRWGPDRIPGSPNAVHGKDHRQEADDSATESDDSLLQDSFVAGSTNLPVLKAAATSQKAPQHSTPASSSAAHSQSQSDEHDANLAGWSNSAFTWGLALGSISTMAAMLVTAGGCYFYRNVVSKRREYDSLE